MSVVIIIRSKVLLSLKFGYMVQQHPCFFYVRTVPYTARLIIPIRPEYKKLDAR